MLWNTPAPLHAVLRVVISFEMFEFNESNDRNNLS